MSQLWALFAWLLSLIAPSDTVEAARCAACVTLAYAAQAKADGPTPPEPTPPGPRPDGCVDGCGCGGTGWVNSPEGFRIPCPCPAGCKCKQAKRGAQ